MRQHKKRPPLPKTAIFKECGVKYIVIMSRDRKMAYVTTATRKRFDAIPAELAEFIIKERQR